MARDTTNRIDREQPSWVNPPRRSMPSVSEMSQGLGTTDNLLDAMLAPAPETVEDSDFETQGISPLSTTTSSNPDRPRTTSAGYDSKNQTLTVVFRDGTWWEYREVPPGMWEAFKGAESKGKYLRSSGLDNWHDMGPVAMDRMPRHRRVQMNELTNQANALYGSKTNNDDWANPAYKG